MSKPLPGLVPQNEILLERAFLLKLIDSKQSPCPFNVLGVTDELQFDLIAEAFFEDDF